MGVCGSCVRVLVHAQVEEEKDDDVVLRKVRVSLNCPLSQMRIAIPARGVNCLHLQCFDLAFYLTCNSRRETWQCPVCSKTTRFDKLVVDAWMKGVLAEADADTVDIELSTGGAWSKVVEDDTPRERKRRRVRSAAAGAAAAVGGDSGSGGVGVASAGTSSPYAAARSAASAASTDPQFGGTEDFEAILRSILCPPDDAHRSGGGGGGAVLSGLAHSSGGASATPPLGLDPFTADEALREMQSLLNPNGGRSAASLGGAGVASAGICEDEPICISDSE